MVSLSVAIITLNEERNLERCLTSVRQVADEIVVVDSGSIDNTLEIAKRFGARIFKQEFLGYTAQKNFANSKCSFEHILSLDADEALSPKLIDEVIKVKESWKFDAYRFNRLTNYCGKWIRYGGWYPDSKVRLFKKSSGKWIGHRIHESFEVFSNRIKHIPGDLHHYSYYSIEEHRAQVEHFSDLASLALFENGKRTSRIKMYLSPIIKFIKMYFLQLGFLDGYYGLIISWISASSRYKRNMKLLKLQ